MLGDGGEGGASLACARWPGAAPGWARLLFVAGAIALLAGGGRRRTRPRASAGAGRLAAICPPRCLNSAVNPFRAWWRCTPARRASAGAADISLPRGSDPATALAAESTQQFGRYTLLKRIGEGGMAEVFTAILSGAEGFERLVVIKRLRPHLALNPDAVAQFIDEAKLGSVLTHSNIVTVSDFGKVGDGYFLAAEYVAGHTLAAIASATSRSSAARCRRRSSSTWRTRCWRRWATRTSAPT